MIQLYNTFTQKKEMLIGTCVNIYSCGITVYDHCHIGHARTFIVFDAMIRYLLKYNININFVRNITDIDDKILLKAFKNKKSLNAITNNFVDEMHVINEQLCLLSPTFEPKATMFIKNIINLVKFLKSSDYAYVAGNNDVYYKITRNCHYGVLSNSVLDQNLVFNRKKHFTSKSFNFDFTLWKSDVKFWSTPWGAGRPGWHSECAAMNLYYFQNKIDIHSGGKDLIFPHHENELAQILPVKGLYFIKIWLHVAHVNVDNKKMSKSLSNYVLVKNVLKKYNEEYLRFFLLLSNYKKKINYSDFEFRKAIKALNNLYNGLLKLKYVNFVHKTFKAKFFTALDDNFNTAKAISILFEILRQSDHDIKLLFTLKYLGNILGLLKYNPKYFLRVKVKKKIVRKLIKKRDIARKEHNWILADNLRFRLERLGCKIVDKKI